MQKLLAILALLTISAPGFCQRDEAEGLRRKFEVYRIHNLTEKIYLHTDNRSYLTGETLWFKIYSVDGSFHKPLAFSQVAYVELLDAGNNPVAQAKIDVSKGFGDGNFYLPPSLATGAYTLRAYTRWMGNFDPEFFFSRQVNILNTVRPDDDPVAPVSSRPIITLFPEGGHLVAGIESKVGFAIHNEAGQGLAYQGFVLSSRNDTVSKLKPLRFGLGSFVFTPQEGEEYRAFVIDEHKRSHPVQFPPISASGFSLAVSENGDYLDVLVRAKSVETPVAYLFVHARNITVSAQAQFLRSNEALFRISKASLPEGIVHLTLFDQELKPRCERLFFKAPGKRLDIELTHGNSAPTRHRVALAIDTKVNGRRVSSNASVSVVKIDSLFDYSEENIFEYLWLSSDLTGTVENPSYYFTNDPDVAQARENLMLTHGWRRFDWKDVLSPDAAKVTAEPELSGHLITFNINEDYAVSDFSLAFLSKPGKNFELFPLRTTGQKQLTFQTKNIYGKTKLVLQTDTAQRLSVSLEDPFLHRFANKGYRLSPVRPQAEQALLLRSIAMQARNIFDLKASGPLLPEEARVPFYGAPDDRYFLDDYTRFPVLEEVMREYVPKVLVRKRRDGFHFRVLDLNSNTHFDEDPLVLLDGVPVSANKILSVNPLEIERLDVIARRYYLAELSAPGIVSFTTYKGALGGFELSPRDFVIDYEGLQARREFYSPNYSTDDKNIRIPDQRHLLYWNPALEIPEENLFETSFFTSDVAGTYMIIVEGINRDGYAGTGISTFVVKGRLEQAKQQR